MLNTAQRKNEVSFTTFPGWITLAFAVTTNEAWHTPLRIIGGQCSRATFKNLEPVGSMAPEMEVGTLLHLHAAATQGLHRW